MLYCGVDYNDFCAQEQLGFRSLHLMSLPSYEDEIEATIETPLFVTYHSWAGVERRMPHLASYRHGTHLHLMLPRNSNNLKHLHHTLYVAKSNMRVSVMYCTSGITEE